jgi:hydroxypyruvate isomerase
MLSTQGIRFDVNCSILFTELPLLARPAAAAAAGFDAVEFWWPFSRPVPHDHEADAFLAAIADAGVSLAALNFAGGDLTAGDRGWLSHPDRSADVRDNVEAAVAIAGRAGCTVLNALYGNRQDGVPEAEQDEVAAENLAVAAGAAASVGATVVVEALNSAESPRYPLVSAAAAVAVIDRVRAEGGVTNVAFLADFYHLGMMGEDLAGVLAAYADRIGHVQIADVPGRGAPGTGTIAFGPLLAELAGLGYRGRVGLEYKPGDPADSSASFGWLTADA